MNMKKILLPLLLLIAGLSSNAFAAFDQSHDQWNKLVKKHVTWNAAATSTSVDYAGFKKDHVLLKSYLSSLSGVKDSEFKQWTKSQQQAFLFNAYNAYTVELILSKYPNLKSIKDLGSLISSPWSKSFFSLLGQKRSLDDVEHKMIRGTKDFNEPRIHFAVNCASIGCPALRPEAFNAAQLESQLEDQTKRFISDRTRNRYNKKAKVLELSSIFDWYGSDFGKAENAKNLNQFLARYAGSLGLSKSEKELLEKGELDIDFLDYDWSLNKKPGA